MEPQGTAQGTACTSYVQLYLLRAVGGMMNFTVDIFSVASFRVISVRLASSFVIYPLISQALDR